MKNALILHGTDGTSKDNWFPWLEQELTKLDFEVWVPDLPQAHTPNFERYNQHIFQNDNFTLNSQSILIGHSSGAVAILGLLQALPKESSVDTCYFVGAFKDDLGWENLSELFLKPLNFSLIKTRARKFIFIHSDNDPHCPLEHAEYLQQELNGELIIRPGQKHFSTSTMGEAYRKFPFLIDLIKQQI